MDAKPLIWAHLGRARLSWAGRGTWLKTLMVSDFFITSPKQARGVRLQTVQKPAPNKAWFQFQKMELANKSDPIPFKPNPVVPCRRSVLSRRVLES